MEVIRNTKFGNVLRIGRVLILKLHYIDNIETELSEMEIKKRLKNIAIEDKFFNLNIKGKKIYHLEFQDNVISFFYLSSVGVQDMLSPRIYIKILKKDKGYTCNLYYRRTWMSLCLFIWWNIFWGLCIWESVQRNNIVHLICYIAAYVLGVWIVERRRISMCKKIVTIKEDL